MISYIRGELCDIEEQKAIVDVNGVGYGIYMPQQALSLLPPMGQQVKIHTYLNIREDAMQLFGFLTKEERSVFRMLINISGVGPKSALSILSCLSVDELRMAVLSDDYKAIAKANGIGPKTAQRLVIELRDKFHLEDVLGEYDEASPATSAPEDIVSETAMALSSLGYSNVEALRAIKKVPDSESMTVEQLLKAALKHII